MKKSIIFSLAGLTNASLALMASERPNILLIVTDDHSQPHVGVNGCPNCQKFELTPNMDTFAADAVRFNKGYVVASHSAPSRAAWFTGRNAVSIRASRFGQTPLPEVPYFMRPLHDAGYWIGITGRSYGPSTEDYDVSYFDHLDGGGTRDEKMPLVGEKLGELIQKSQSQNKPFFIYQGITQPHTPWPNIHPNIADVNELVLPPDWVDTPDQREHYARYLQAVHEADDIVGQIVAKLKELGEYDNTLIVLMGDNGDSLDRRKCSGFNYGFNVAFMMKHPDMDPTLAGTELFEPIQSLDLAPTFMRFAGLEPLAEMEGKDLSPLLKNDPNFVGHKYINVQRGWHQGGFIGVGAFKFVRSVTDGRYWYVYYPVSYREELENSANYNPVFALYDLDNDPHSMNNLAGKVEYSAKEEELRNEMERWMIQNADFLPLPSSFSKTTTAN